MRIFLLCVFLSLYANARTCKDILNIKEPPVWRLTRALFDRLSKENSWQETLWTFKAKNDPRAGLLEDYILETLRSDYYLIERSKGGASDAQLVIFRNGMKAIRKLDVIKHNHTRGSVASYVIDRHANHSSSYPVTALRIEGGIDVSLQLYIPGLKLIREDLTRRDLSRIFLADLINDELDRFREDHDEKIFNLQKMPNGRLVAFDGGQSHYGAHNRYVVKPDEYFSNPLVWSFRLRRCCLENKREHKISLEKEIQYLIHLFGNKLPESLVEYEKIDEAKLRADLHGIITPTEIDRVFVRIRHFSQVLRQIYEAPK